MLTRDNAGLSQKLAQQAGSGYVHIQAAELRVTASDAPVNVTTLVFIARPESLTLSELYQFET